MGVAIGGFALGWLSLKIVPFALVAFVVLVILHERNARLQARAARAVKHYEFGLKRLAGEWAGHGNAGGSYKNAQHPYAEDLDLFGVGGLFELLSQTRSRPGDDTLAHWLMEPASRDEAIARQEAVNELRAQVDLRERLQLVGEDTRAELHPAAMAKWGAAPPNRAFPGAAIAMALSAAAAIVTFGLFLAGVADLRPFAVVFAISTGLSLAAGGFVQKVMAGLDSRAKDLHLAAEVMGLAAAGQFETPRLKQLQQSLGSGVAAIRKLEFRIGLLDTARNQFLIPAALATAWVPQVALAIERWRQEHGSEIETWLQALGEFESLLSLSAYAYENPDAVFPELSNGGRSFAAELLEHPLIPTAKSVANSIALGPNTPLVVISGSNMSGKSTMLRAVGLGTALAWAGAPVRASRLTVSPFQLAASIRTQDSVQEGKSRFYAEIQRLRQIVDLTRESRPVLFLVDEILSGTNSHDRLIGAEAVLRDLVNRNAVGLATTHDLALTRISGAVNKHFEDEIEDGELHFDYQLRPGVVERSNALDLMRSIGLDISPKADGDKGHDPDYGHG